MIREPTVLVLGAGASMDYGFPSGWQLACNVVHGCLQNAQLTQLILQKSYTQDQIREFGIALRDSGSRSVDMFLANRDDLVPLGKLAIAGALIPHEVSANVHAMGTGPGWLRILFERLYASRNLWKRNALSIVTFNYDRVIEHFLHYAIMNQFGLSAADAADLLTSTVQVVHVHGQMGLLAEMVGDDPRARRFEPQLTVQSLSTAAEGIRILHEGADGDDPFVLARHLIEQAAQVIFLGFGYHPVNMQRLALQYTLRGKSVLGSSVGMSFRDRELVGRDTQTLLKVDPRGQDLPTFLCDNPILGH